MRADFVSQGGASPSSGGERISIVPSIRTLHSTLELPSVGTLGYYSDTEAGGVPVVLVHSAGIGASTREVVPLFEMLRKARTAYALDVPGFGTSTRILRHPDLQQVRDAIRTFMTRLASNHATNVDVIAVGLSSEFVAQVALEERNPIRSLTLISPTGLSAREESPWADVVARAGEGVLRAPLLGGLAYTALTSRINTRWRLHKHFSGPVDEALVEDTVAASHSPTARFANASVLGRRLHTKDACSTLYGHIRVPTLVLFDEDPTTSFDRLPQLVARNAEVRARRIAHTKGMPHYEMTSEVLKLIEAFYDDRGLPTHQANFHH